MFFSNQTSINRGRVVEREEIGGGRGGHIVRSRRKGRWGRGKKRMTRRNTIR